MIRAAPRRGRHHWSAAGPRLLRRAAALARRDLRRGSGVAHHARRCDDQLLDQTNDKNIAFTKAMIAWMESSFCVDPARILSVGMSVGGYMSNTIGCEMPDVFRAIAVMSGSAPESGCKSHDIAAWMTHGTADTTISISSDETERDQFLADNHCGATMEPVDPSPCVSYDGCDSGDPVVWCPVDGEGHTIPSFAAGGIASFFSQF